MSSETVPSQSFADLWSAYYRQYFAIACTPDGQRQDFMYVCRREWLKRVVNQNLCVLDMGEWNMTKEHTEQIAEALGWTKREMTTAMAEVYGVQRREEGRPQNDIRPGLKHPSHDRDRQSLSDNVENDSPGSKVESKDKRSTSLYDLLPIFLEGHETDYDIAVHLKLMEKWFREGQQRSIELLLKHAQGLSLGEKCKEKAIFDQDIHALTREIRSQWVNRFVESEYLEDDENSTPRAVPQSPVMPSPIEIEIELETYKKSKMFWGRMKPPVRRLADGTEAKQTDTPGLNGPKVSGHHNKGANEQERITPQRTRTSADFCNSDNEEPGTIQGDLSDDGDVPPTGTYVGRRPRKEEVVDFAQGRHSWGYTPRSKPVRTMAGVHVNHGDTIGGSTSTSDKYIMVQNVPHIIQRDSIALEDAEEGSRWMNAVSLVANKSTVTSVANPSTTIQSSVQPIDIQANKAGDGGYKKGGKHSYRRLNGETINAANVPNGPMASTRAPTGQYFSPIVEEELPRNTPKNRVPGGGIYPSSIRREMAETNKHGAEGPYKSGTSSSASSSSLSGSDKEGSGTSSIRTRGPSKPHASVKSAWKSVDKREPRQHR